MIIVAIRAGAGDLSPVVPMPVRPVEGEDGLVCRVVGVIAVGAGHNRAI